MEEKPTKYIRRFSYEYKKRLWKRWEKRHTLFAQREEDLGGSKVVGTDGGMEGAKVDRAPQGQCPIEERQILRSKW